VVRLAGTAGIRLSALQQAALGCLFCGESNLSVYHNILIYR